MAAAKEFKKVTMNLKSGLLRQLFLQPAEFTIGEINDLATARANQMVVMLWRPPYQIAMAATSNVYLADKPNLCKYLNGAINSDQTNAGVLFM